MPTKIEQIIVTTVIDAMIEDAIKECQEELLNNLIGKKYIPQDNSYIREIVNGEKINCYGRLIGVPCQIISRPYITEVDTFGKDKRRRMIKVKSLKTGLIYEVLFAESWICD